MKRFTKCLCFYIYIRERYISIINSTILIISRRLITFQDYNYALIIEHGIIAEFGSIETLYESKFIL